MNCLSNISNHLSRRVVGDGSSAPQMILNLSGSAHLEAWGISPNGQYIVDCTAGRVVKVSNNYGASFTTVTSAPSSLQSATKCYISNNGQYILLSTQVYYTSCFSTNGGTSWTSLNGGSTCTASMSGTGQYMAYCGLGVGIYVSTNYGSSFSQNHTSNTWGSIAISNDGSKMFATRFNATGTLISTNSGGTFAAGPNTGSMGLEGAYVSGNGTHMIANGSSATTLYTSDNTGSSFTLANSTVATNINKIQSAAGFALANDGTIYFGYDTKIYKTTDKFATMSLFSTSQQAVARVADGNSQYQITVGSLNCKYILTSTASQLWLTTDPTLTET